MPSRRGLVISDEQMKLIEAVLERLRAVSGSQFAALISTSGQPIAVSPRDGGSDTLSLAALAASSFAATRQLAQILSEREFTLLFHEGKEHNLHVMQVTDHILLLITFGHETQVGRVRLYTTRALEVLKPALESAENTSGGQPNGRSRIHPRDRRRDRRSVLRAGRVVTGEPSVALINLAAREINYKIVYYGCGLCGKTTNIQYIHRRLNPSARGRLVSLATEEERTLYFDFLPLTVGTVKGLRTRFHLYTVPGQSFYNASRKLVLQGTDGVVFVATAN